MSGKEARRPADELDPVIRALGERFLRRRDLYARQLDDGRYVAVYEPLETNHLAAHLRGELTLGAYVLDAESNGRFLVLDADDEPDWRRLQALAGVLAEMACHAYLERSRRGGHLWLFLVDSEPGRQIRLFGQGLLHHFGITDLELFPKQDRLRTGPGSLIRLPFGVHRKSGRRYGFYTVNDEPLAPTLREQILVLEAPETVPERLFEEFVEVGASLRRKPRSQPADAVNETPTRLSGDLSLSEQIKGAVPVRAFVLRYLELSPAGRGLCPFHDDQVASFSVNDQENFWYCFACERGGSIIDFWMEWQKIDFKTALKELAGMLVDGAQEEPEVVDGQVILT